MHRSAICRRNSSENIRERTIHVFQKGLKDGIPIALGYFSVSIAFGLMAVQCGLSWFEALLISFTNLTSAGQFAGVTVIAGMGSYLELP